MAADELALETRTNRQAHSDSVFLQTDVARMADPKRRMNYFEEEDVLHLIIAEGEELPLDIAPL
jgi:hypothetical protein